VIKSGLEVGADSRPLIEEVLSGIPLNPVGGAMSIESAAAMAQPRRGGMCRIVEINAAPNGARRSP
jgi:hypothetical protein